MQKLIIIEMVGNALDIVDAVSAINAVRPTYEVIGYLTQDAKRLMA